MVTCRYTDAWTCTLYRKEGGKNTVDTKTCELCMKAREITKIAAMMDSTKYICGKVNKAIRTMNTYTHRLARALDKLEAEE